MNEQLSYSITFFAIYAVYFFTFLLAGGGKIKEGKVPDWFRGQFEKSLIGTFPGISIAYWGIALVECVIPVLVILSLVRMEFLGSDHFFIQLAVSIASFLFFMLGFGQRLVNDFPGAANSFFYFAGTLVTSFWLAR